MPVKIALRTNRGNLTTNLRELHQVRVYDIQFKGEIVAVEPRSDTRCLRVGKQHGLVR